MAILSSLPGITVSVLTADSADPVIEYPCDEEAADVPADQRHKATTKFIQSSPGKKFAFKLNIDPSHKHDKLKCPMLAFVFIINGIDEGSGQLYHPMFLDAKGCWEHIVWGWQIKRGGQTVLIPFKFAVLKTNEESPDHLTSDELEALEKLGMVEVEIYRHGDSEVPKEREEEQEFSDPITEVPEKTVKGHAISHTVEFSEGEPLEEETPLQENEFLDKDGEDKPIPIAVFRFKYRSKDDLQKSFIIPRSPSTESRPQRAFEDLNIKDFNNFAKAGHNKKEWARKELCKDRGEKFLANDFKRLSKDEKRKLARIEFESMNGGPGGPPVKPEPGRARIAYLLLGKKRKRAPKEIRREDWKVLIDLVDDDEDGAQSPAVAERTSKEKDDVVFVSANSVRKARAERAAAAGRRVKNED